MDIVQRLQDEQEAIADAMDDLMIFPSQEVLRRSLQQIEVHFANEERAMRQRGVSDDNYEALMKDQKQIVDLARSALQLAAAGAKSTNTSCNNNKG